MIVGDTLCNLLRVQSSSNNVIEKGLSLTSKCSSDISLLESISNPGSLLGSEDVMQCLISISHQLSNLDILLQYGLPLHSSEKLNNLVNAAISSYTTVLTALKTSFTSVSKVSTGTFKRHIL